MIVKSKIVISCAYYSENQNPVFEVYTSLLRVHNQLFASSFSDFSSLNLKYLEMRSLLPLILFALFIGCFTQHGGIARMQELKTKVDPIRSFDLPDEAPRARIIATDFLTRGNRKMKKPFKVRF